MRLIAAITLLCAAGLLTGGCGEQSVESLKADAREAFVQEDYGQVRRLLQQVLAKAPSDRESLFLIGTAYRRDQVYDSALIYLKRADLYAPNDRETNRQLYDLGQLMNDWQVSIDAIGVLIRTGDRPEDHYAKLGELWGKDNHPYNAYYWTRKALEYDSTRAELLMTAAFYGGIVDSNDAALKYIDRAEAYYGSQRDFTIARGIYFMQTERPERAEIYFREVLLLDTAAVQSKLNLARALVSIDGREKKLEGLTIYKSLIGRVGAELKVDSIVAALESTLTLPAKKPAALPN